MKNKLNKTPSNGLPCEYYVLEYFQCNKTMNLTQCAHENKITPK